MTTPSLAEVCMSLGLLQKAQAEQLQVLAIKKGGADKAAIDLAFAKAVLDAGVLDEENLARAVAQQFRLNMVPAERLQKLKVDERILELLPASLMWEHLLVPTFFDEENKVLSVLTSDPGNVAVLREVQAASKASRLRLFVAPRTAIRELLKRLLPEKPPTSRTLVPLETILYESTPALVEPLKRLALIEASSVRVLTSLPELEQFMATHRVGRVLVREALAAALSAALAGKALTAQLISIPSWLASSTPGGGSEFQLSLIELMLQVAETQLQEARIRTRRSWKIVQSLAAELGLPLEEREAVGAGVLLLEVDESGSIARAVELLPLLNAPAQIRFLLEGLSARISGQEGPGNQLAVEVLYTARAAVRLNIYEGDDPIVAFGQESARHDGRVLKALAAVLKRGARPTPVGQAPLVVLAERDINLLTGLESRLTEAGFRVMTVGDGDQVLAQVRTRPVAAVISGIRLPTKDGIAMLMELKRDDRFSRLPVLLLGEGGAADVSRGLDLGADDVVQRPIHPEAVLARLRKLLDQRRSNKSAGINGTISGLPLVDLIQILMMGGRTAWIRVATSNEEGSLQLRSGQLTAATIGTDWTGEEALYALVDLDEGHFEVFFEDRGQSNLNGSSEFLLLEAVRRRDERRGS